MEKLVNGFQRFRDHAFAPLKELFEQLGSGQRPQALFITCSDSRIDPNLITQTQPGDLFVVRNAGNLVPPYGSSPCGEAASIEYAIEQLRVSDVVVCGHSQCGAMDALISGPNAAGGMSAVRAWLEVADATRRIVQCCYADREPKQRLNLAIQENVLQQVRNLCTHPSVAARLVQGTLRIHAWVYKFTTGEIFAFDAREGQFRPLRDQPPAMSARQPLIDALGA